MNWDWSVVDAFMPRFWDGVWVTLKVVFFGTLIAFLLGLFWAVVLRSRVRWIRWPVLSITEFIRNTPLLVQLFFLFYVLPEWGPAWSPMTTGIIGLGLHFSTYTAEVYRAGIDGVPRGQWEAAVALSLSRTRTWVAVILPQAIRRVIPALGNYVIAMLKDSPMVAVIGALDMLGEAESYSNETFTTEAYTIVGIAFLVIAYLASLLVRAVERRFAHSTS